MHLSKTIARGIEIVGQIAALKAELKAIETLVESAAFVADHLPLNEPDREGRQAILEGCGVSLPVIFESDLVSATLPDLGHQMANIRAMVPDKAILSQLWRPSLSLERLAKDGQAYRRQLRSLLAPEAAAGVLQASLMRDKTGIPKSRVIIAWDRVQPTA